jgi:hypothetical protein
MLHRSKVVALGSPAAASRGNVLRRSWAPRLGSFPRRLASLINLAGPAGPALFLRRRYVAALPQGAPDGRWQVLLRRRLLGNYLELDET